MILLRSYKNKILNFLYLFIFLSISSCRTDFIVDTYTSDYFFNENVVTTAQVAVEIPSCNSEKIEEYKSDFLLLFSKDSNAKLVDCKSEGFSDYLVAQITAEMATNTSNKDIVLWRKSQGSMDIDGKKYEVMGLQPDLHKDFLKRINNLLEDNYETLDADDMKFMLVLNNDERGEVLVSSNQVWVDGEPKLNYYRQPLQRRDKITIRFNNLVNELIIRREPVINIFVYRPIEN